MQLQLPLLCWRSTLLEQTSKWYNNLCFSAMDLGQINNSMITSLKLVPLGFNVARFTCLWIWVMDDIRLCNEETPQLSQKSSTTSHQRTTNQTRRWWILELSKYRPIHTLNPGENPSPARPKDQNKMFFGKKLHWGISLEKIPCKLCGEEPNFNKAPADKSNSSKKETWQKQVQRAAMAKQLYSERKRAGGGERIQKLW